MAGKIAVPDQFYFNLDGALLNAREDILDCLASTLRSHAGCGVTEQQFTEHYTHHWGVSLNELLQGLSGCSVAQAADLAVEYHHVCEQRGFVKTLVSEDLHELLHLLDRNGAQMHCVSSYIPDPDTLLREKNLHRYFHGIVNTMESRTKFWHQQLTGIEKQKACIVSDRAIDLQYGVVQKIVAAAVTWGVDDQWDLGITTPDVILTSALECKRFFIDGVLPNG